MSFPVVWQLRKKGHQVVAITETDVWMSRQLNESESSRLAASLQRGNPAQSAFTARSTRIALAAFWCMDHETLGDAILQYAPMEVNVADLLTKPQGPAPLISSRKPAVTASVIS